jgi:hypothetical protein
VPEKLSVVKVVPKAPTEVVQWKIVLWKIGP